VVVDERAAAVKEREREEPVGAWSLECEYDRAVVLLVERSVELKRGARTDRDRAEGGEHGLVLVVEDNEGEVDEVAIQVNLSCRAGDHACDGACYPVDVDCADV